MFDADTSTPPPFPPFGSGWRQLKSVAVEHLPPGGRRCQDSSHPTLQDTTHRCLLLLTNLQCTASKVECAHELLTEMLVGATDCQRDNPMMYLATGCPASRVSSKGKSWERGEIQLRQHITADK